MGTYTVWGYVLADKLPDHLKLPTATIRREPEGSPLYPTRQRTQVGKVSTEGGQYLASVAPAHLELDSRWTIGFEGISASDPDEALLKAQRERAPAVLAALELVSGGPAFLTFIGAEDHSAAVVINESLWSPTGMFRIYAPSELGPNDARRVASSIGAIQSDDTARRSAGLLRDAINRSNTFGGDHAARASALFDAVRAIEALVVATARDAPKDPDLREKQQRIVDNLKRALAKNHSTKRAVAAVNAHNRDLQSLNNATTRARIRLAGERLHALPAQIREAEILWDLRSRSLGHAADPPRIEDNTLNSAFDLARAFLALYCDAKQQSTTN